MTDKDAAEVVATRMAAYEEIAAWHDKQSCMCRDVAHDSPRLSDETRKRASLIASHHAANAAYIRTNFVRAAAIRAAKEAEE